MGKLRVYWLKALNKLSIYPLGNTPSAPSEKACAGAARKGNGRGDEDEKDEEETKCHRHGRLTRLLLDSFFNFAKSNSSLTLVDLIFLLILSVHITLILSYPYIFTFTLTHSLSFFQMHWLLL